MVYFGVSFKGQEVNTQRRIQMQKKLWIEILVYSLLLVTFIYLNLKNDMPTVYLITLIVAYLSVIIYKINRLIKLKSSDAN